MPKKKSNIGPFDYFAAAALKGLLASGNYPVGRDGEGEHPGLNFAVVGARYVAKRMCELRQADMEARALEAAANPPPATSVVVDLAQPAPAPAPTTP